MPPPSRDRLASALLRQAAPEGVPSVPQPEFAGRTNRDLVQWGLDTRDALRACNADKAALAEMGRP